MNSELCGGCSRRIKAQNVSSHEHQGGSCRGCEDGTVEINHDEQWAFNQEGLFKHHSNGPITGCKTLHGLPTFLSPDCSSLNQGT